MAISGGILQNSFTFRQARLSDYQAFARAEQQAWKQSGVPIISEKIFATWLDVFPEGLVLVEHEGTVCGHHFAQIISFDPNDTQDNRSWHELTDFGSCVQTHNPNGNTFYGVSISAAVRGAGRAVFQYALSQVQAFGLHRYAGACRMPGLVSYALALQMSVDEVVGEYVRRVVDAELKDPTLSALLSISGVRTHRAISEYFEDPQSANWACLLSYEPS